jgi:hypothetical protein
MPYSNINTDQLVIEAGQKLSYVQKQFNDHFPFLKIEFFITRHQAHAASLRKDMITGDLTVKQLHASHRAEPIIVSPDMAVSNLEQLFQQRFHISVQVFRKSGRSWLETSFTDDWSLKQQNDQGRELSRFA